MEATIGTVITREESPPFITKEEFPVLVQEEIERWLRDTPSIRYQLTGIMAETFAQKTDLQAILERIDAQGERIEEQGKRIEEQGERIEEQGKRIEALREDFNRQFAEHSRRMDTMEEQIKALREDFNRGFALLSGRIDSLSERVDTLSRDVGKVDSHLGALGARWGLMAESAFRNGLADILAREAGLKVVRYHKMDTKGFVFGRPDQVEIDVVVQNGEHTLIEIKSSTSRQEVHNFARKVAFYEKEEGVKARRMIIISPMFGPRAIELAGDLGIETFTSVYDVSIW